MAVTVPGFQDVILPLLQLAAERSSLRLSDAVAELAGRLDLSESDRHEMLGSGGQTRFANRVHWAKFYLIIPLTHPVMMARYGCGSVLAQA